MDRNESGHRRAGNDHHRGGGDDYRRHNRDDQQQSSRRHEQQREPRDRHINDRDFQRRGDDHRRGGGGASTQNQVKREREDSQDRDRHRDHREQPQRDQARFKREHSRSPDTKANRYRKRNIKEEDTGNHEWGKRGGGGDSNAKDGEDAAPVEKEKPNFGLSGKLTEDTNKVNGVVIKYAEPQEARKPKRRWRLYPFKGDQALPTMFIHRQSCYLIGRDRKICDLPVDHPSCSKQHAVLQFRLVPYTKEDGTKSQRVRPYVLDMESANGTYVNNKPIDPKKYVELLEKDVIKFGYSSREYVLLHENSKDEELDDDIDVAAEAVAEAAQHQQSREESNRTASLAAVRR